MTIIEHPPTPGHPVTVDPHELAAWLAAETDLVRRLELALGCPFNQSEPVAAIWADVHCHLGSQGLPGDRLDDVADDVLEILEWISVDRMTDISQLDSVIASRTPDRAGATVIDLNNTRTHHHDERKHS